MLEEILFDSEISRSTRDQEQLDLARKLIIQYILKLIPSSTFIRKVKCLNRKVRDEVLSVKRRVIDRTEYFLSSLWRALHYVVRHYVKVDVACKKYGVHREDILLLMEILDSGDIRRVERSRVSLEKLSEVEKEDIYDSIQKHISVLIGRGRGSPRFISTNDPVYSLKDIERILWEEGHRLLLYYEHFGNPDKIRNYVKQGMRHYCVNFILYNQAACRQAISAVEGDSSREFKIKRVSIDYTPSDGSTSDSTNSADSSNSSLGDRIEDKDGVRPDAIFERKWLLESLGTKTPVVIRKFVRIVVGDRFGKDFRRWLRIVHGLEAEQVAADYPKLGKFAMEFLGISQKKVIKSVSPFLLEDNSRRMEVAA
jgi:hypothetical protein